MTAFQRMADSKEFKTWHQMEVLRRTGIQAQIDAEVAKELKKVKIEVRRDGIWTEVQESELDNEQDE